MGRVALEAGLLAALLSAALTPLLIHVSRGVGLVDSPTTGKIHLYPTPTAGGLVVFVAFFSTLWGIALRMGRSGEMDLRTLGGLTLASVLIVALGLYDDVRGAGVWQKLAVQIPAGLLLYLAGFRVDRLTNPFGSEILLGPLALPLTLLWVLTITNALNLIDGLDGLATGIALIATLTLATVGLARGEVLVLVLASTLGGSLLGFVGYNFPPARIFLGDTGSLLLGLLLSAISLVENRKATLAMTLVVPIVAMLIPILDTLWAVVRRVKNRQHLFRGDTDHLHHRLLMLGLPQRRAVLLMWATGAYFGLLAFVLSVLPKEQVLWAVVLLGAGVYAALSFLRHLERRAKAHRQSPLPSAEKNPGPKASGNGK